jgi:carbonic anhydrase
MMSSQQLSSLRDLLHDGVHRFHTEVYAKHQQEYERAATTPQQPHTLFVTCADSRIDPEAITQSGPGQIFVARNVGNIVPAYGEMLGGVSAVIEYAVSALRVSQVVVCGHSDCGAMKGLLQRDTLRSLPVVDRWLQNAEAALSVARAKRADADEKALLPELTQENVLLQLAHLRTHPAVAGRLAEGTLAVYGWVYDIGSGAVREYDAAAERFAEI